jgi:hypothetical protein
MSVTLLPHNPHPSPSLIKRHTLSLEDSSENFLNRYKNLKRSQIPDFSCLLSLNLFGGLEESPQVLSLEVGARQLTPVKVNLRLIPEQGRESHTHVTQLSG